MKMTELMDELACPFLTKWRSRIMERLAACETAAVGAIAARCYLLGTGVLYRRQGN